MKISEQFGIINNVCRESWQRMLSKDKLNLKPISSSEETISLGIKTLKISLFILLATGLLQVIIFLMSGSAALFADTVHNIADALTSIPLWIAFVLLKRKPTRTFTYGYGRAEDAAGIIIILVILISGIAAIYESFEKLNNPEVITNTNWVMTAGVIGFIGNEIVAKYRIKTGKEIGSASLIADGKHSRIDGLTSLGVLLGALAVKLGHPIVDPIIGIIISFFIFGILIETSKEIFKRLLDVVEPSLLDNIEKTASDVPNVKSVHDVKARWIGHQIYIETSIAVDENISVKEGHSIAVEVHHELLHKIPHLKNITIHVDPVNQIGEKEHLL